MYSLDQQSGITQILSSDFSQKDEVGMFPLPPTKTIKSLDVTHKNPQKGVKGSQEWDILQGSGRDGPMDGMPVSSLSFWPKA